jgi:ABC-type oligopeptide transport system substrate-binding subunit
MNAEKWGGNSQTFDISQTAEVPNGTYIVTWNGFYRYNNTADNTNDIAVAAHADGTEVINSFVYINGKDYALTSIADDAASAALEGKLPFSQGEASAAFAQGLYAQSAEVIVTDGKLTAAPEGAALSHEVWIPADGAGDHPSFMMCSEASKALEKIGMKLIVTDLANSSELWTSIEADQADMWCAAWGASVDPDMYQIYYSDVANGGAQPGGSNYMYDIADPELDRLIVDARKSLDQAYRKTMYKACLDLIVDWAVEVPVYQRQNAIIFSTERLDMKTVTPDITTFYGWNQEIENIRTK